MTEQAVVQWITQYGYLGMFFLLILGIVGLPVPDEWLLVISGYLAFKNVLGFAPTVAVAFIGSAGGFTMSYVLGRTSSGFMIRRYGHWFSIDDEMNGRLSSEVSGQRPDQRVVTESSLHRSEDLRADTRTV